MNAVLWGVQGFLALVFLGTGLIKLTQPVNKVRQLVPDLFSIGFVRTLGGLEVLGAIGILVPWLTGVLPVLTPLSALCMGLVLIGASIIHGRQGEWSKLMFIVVLLLLSVLVAYYRF